MRRWHAAVAWLGYPAEQVLIEADGERLTRVEPGVPAPPDALRLHGLTMPGLANAHSHAFHRALRASTHAAGDFWRWREQMYRLAATLDPDSYRQLATAVYAEMALAGITAVGEFHYLHHDPSGRRYAEPNVMAHALIAAADAAGVRLTLLDACYLRGGFGQEVQGPQRRFCDGDVERWTERVDLLADAPRVRIAAAIHSVRAVPAAAMPTVQAWTRSRGTCLHVHVSEQPAENAACRAATGRSPTQLLSSAGVLGPATTAVHATHVGGDDIRVLGGSGAAVCLCPTTERDLADGIGPGRALADAGSPLCVGSDSHAHIDLFEEARAIELDERLATRRRGLHRPEDLLAAATVGGMRALGWDVELRPGALADFTTVDLASVRTAGADTASAAAATVFAASAADVTDVVVGGRDVVRERRHTTIPDVPGALAAAVRRVAPDRGG